MVDTEHEYRLASRVPFVRSTQYTACLPPPSPVVTPMPQPKPRTSNFKHMLRKHGCSGHRCAPAYPPLSRTMHLGTVPLAANCRRSPSCAGCRASWPAIGPFVPSPSPPRGGPAGGTKVDLLHGTTRTSLLPLRIVAVVVSRCSDPQRRANPHRGTE